ncbi:uncharacterized protein L203_100716 [Cryptococcus depauperatus CBS 7841]|uniref:Uncharacterized protein n=1 Tax=Cryptococcus depauperatus CBS 7841 TaxID=1295531 RepID=A0A1E3IXS7_9TREE|nr:transcription initiation factor TFIIF subunit alpha [Cryptococcus depauperatus CBS 7841]
MADASLFLRKNKDKQRRRNVTITPRTATNDSPSLPSQHPPRIPLDSSASAATSRASPSTSTAIKTEPSSSNVTEIKILSTGANNGLRYNLMRLNSIKDVDPVRITQPILMNRKKPGPKEPPTFALDDNGKIIGRYVYDTEGKPVLNDEAKPTIEKNEQADMSLIGSAPGGKKRKTKRGTKEVFHQDIEIMRLRREEAFPWVLESGHPQEKPAQPEQWVGRMVEQGQLSTVLLCNDGTSEGFELVPLGRTYKFEPARPFKPLDSDAANKLFELQAKQKIHDRWALRPADIGEGSSTSSPVPQVKVEHGLEERASKMEQRIKLSKGMRIDKRPKAEKYEDDFKREGHRVDLGLEGGVEEELDFDEAEEFQDDDDNNTFYHDAREEEEARELEERMKKEFRLANANVGDRPQIAAEGDEDDLFGYNSLNDEGKKLKKIMRKRMKENGEDYDVDEDEESDSDSDSETEIKDKENEKENEDKKDPTSANASQPSPRPISRPPTARTASPASKRFPSPKKGKASTAPPGSGTSLLVQRATSRGASPRPTTPGSSAGRAASPLGRVHSLDGGLSRGTTPVDRGSSPPSVPTSAQGGSPTSATREASPAPSTGSSQTGKKARPASGASSTKRKSSPSAGSSSHNRPKKQKKGSTPLSQPEDIPPFPDMITKQDVLNWFRSNKKPSVPMSEAIGAFRKRIVGAGTNRDANQKLFLGWIRLLADQEAGSLKLKSEYRR